MKNLKLFFLFFSLFLSSSYAQLQVVSTSPLNGAYNVAAGQSISVTFNEPLDTTMHFNEQNYIINNIHLNGEETYSFSTDHKTIIFTAQTIADKDYSFCFYGIRSASGDTLQNPYLYRFTTEAAFSGVNVSGKVTSCDTAISVKNTLVALLNRPVEEDSSRPILVTMVGDDGNYTLPYVKNGVYFAVAVKDIDNNGEIDDNDRFAFVDSIIVQGTDVDNINFNLPCIINYSFAEVRAKMDSAARVDIPGFENYKLISVMGHDIHPDGRVREWEFLYKKNGSLHDWYDGMFSSWSGVEIDFESDDFSGWYPPGEIIPLDTNVVHAANPDSLIIYAEAHGGAEFRNQYIPEGYELHVELQLGWLNGRGFQAPDNGLYWGLQYIIDKNDGPVYTVYKEKEFIADLETGQIVLINGVDDNNQSPAKFELEQNYPNPFSAKGGSTTTINYVIARSPDMSGTRQSPELSVQLTVYDILGRKVITLVNKAQTPGTYSVKFDASKLSSGIYFYTLRAGNFSATKKMILMK